jgi:hypothetical protein
MKIRITNPMQIDWINHGSNVSDSEGIPWHMTTGAEEGINSSPRAHLLTEELTQEILAECQFSKEPAVTQVYALFDGTKFSQWAEIVTDNHLFAGDLGPSVLYGRGICIPLPLGQVNDRPLGEALRFLKYRGEVLATVDCQGLVVNFRLGSQIAMLQLYSFLLRRNRVTSLFDFLLNGTPLAFTEKISINCLVSPCGWPFVNDLPPINIPTELRQNLFMLPPVGMVVASGNSLKEVRMRLKAALHQIENKNAGVQYRIDAHYCKGLVLSAPTYGELVGS